MEILYEVNLVSSRNIEETDLGRYFRMSALIETLRCLFACVVIVQSWTLEQKASNLYVITCARNRG